jgi:hypothetical protein
MNLSTVNPADLLGTLFERAKAADEFEFCSTLLRLRGMEDAGWDPLHESLELSQQLMSLQNAPLDKGLQLRLALFLYCHLTEMSDVYNIPANMLQVISGHRYSMSPFSIGLQLGQNPPSSPIGKARTLKALADALNMQELGEVFEEMIVKEVRNAFYHSDYILTNESLNIRHGEGVVINGMRDNRVPYEWLLPRLQLGINTALAVLNLTKDTIRSYRQDQILQGRLGAAGERIIIQLTTHPDFGLTGFKTPPDPDLIANDSY